MIEKTVLNYLSATLSVPVCTETPEKPHGEFVLIEKTGSGRNNKINDATFAIQSYAGTLLAAAELNETVKSALDNITDLDEICRVSLNSDYNYTDTASKRYRYQAVYDITYY
ncbi:MAG: hypothetical protein EOM30_03265 [Clostridia bacterium]|nr:hypothetical protein [Clostridia bacterium]NLS85585.1 hypothetical protein [Oscillospiraceae bacterium]